jgi:ABC-type polar amino acid transport system ATPase subunit
MHASDLAIQLDRISRYYSMGLAILSLLREQSQRGMTTVTVTYERSLAEQFADRLAIMGDGKLLSTSSAKGFAQ